MAEKVNINWINEREVWIEEDRLFLDEDNILNIIAAGEVYSTKISLRKIIPE